MISTLSFKNMTTTLINAFINDHSSHSFAKKALLKFCAAHKLYISDYLACLVKSFANLDFLGVFCTVEAIIGIHVIQPYLKHISFDKINNSELIPTVQALYDDLQGCDAMDLVDLSRHALKFITAESF